MYVKFRSDRGLVHAGFQANYSIGMSSEKFFCTLSISVSCGADTCGGTIVVDQSGSITSPNYPQAYALSTSYNCEWQVQVPVGHFITFVTQDFNLLGSDRLNCSIGDYVEIREYNKTGERGFDMDLFAMLGELRNG